MFLVRNAFNYNEGIKMTDAIPGQLLFSFMYDSDDECEACVCAKAPSTTQEKDPIEILVGVDSTEE